MRILFSLILAVFFLTTFANNSLYQQLGIPGAGSAPTPSGPLHAAEAFAISTHANVGRVDVQFEIAKGYYLYRHKLAFKLQKGADATIGQFKLPKGIWRTDPFFGKQQVYTGQLNFSVPIEGPASHNAHLTIHYQGCSNTLCYPPQNTVVKLLSDPTAKPSKQANNRSLFSGKPVLFSLLILFATGILLAFTPCVLPMVPILSGIILGQKNRSMTRGLTLSLSYVLGMAITYAILGYIITKIGASFQAAVQSPGVIIAISILFTVLAISMFGFFNLQLPLFIRHKVMLADQKLKGGTVISTFIMGILSTLVISPCTSAPLIGVLSFMIQTGDTTLGALSLFVMALGMGAPLILISVGLGKWLPKTGAWMQKVRVFVGVLMLCVAIYLLSRIMSMSIILILSGAVAVIYAVYLGTYRKAKSNLARFCRGIGIVMTLYGAALVVGGLMGNNSFIKPLSVHHNVKKAHGHFIVVKSLSALQQQLQLARQNHQRAVIDFYANWCVECRKLATFVFPNPKVLHALKPYRLIQVDVTESNPTSQKVMRHYQIIGLPTLIFIGNQGHEFKRLYGDISAEHLIDTATSSA